jgi:hypothetical protein
MNAVHHISIPGRVGSSLFCRKSSGPDLFNQKSPDAYAVQQKKTR